MDGDAGELGHIDKLVVVGSRTKGQRGFGHHGEPQRKTRRHDSGRHDLGERRPHGDVQVDLIWMKRENQKPWL